MSSIYPWRAEQKSVRQLDMTPFDERLAMVRAELIRQTAMLPAGTLQHMRARISEVDPEWMASAIRLMQSD